MTQDFEDDIQIFINEENDIYYSDAEGEVNVSMAIMDWLENASPEDDAEEFTANLVLVREAARKLLDAADSRMGEIGKAAEES